MTFQRPEDPAHNLPTPLSSFVGRGPELAALERLLGSTRLLTLTGAGGCGKTRLALEIARRALHWYPDGVWLASLAPLGEASMVTHAAAAVLEIHQAPLQSLMESMAIQLGRRRTLLLLDHCEHVIAQAASVAETLLRAAAGLTILATSREALGIVGETTWRVPSLRRPDPFPPALPDDLLQCEAMQVLTERAASARSTFALTADNADAAIAICRRVDGIPLALELAAARLKLHSIEQIDELLDERFRLLTGTGGTPPGRQHTMEATIGWSYDLLPDAAQLLLRRLSIFPAEWTLEATVQVCAGDGIDASDVLDLTTRLVETSLVNVDAGRDGRVRYRCPESVRHYCQERLLSAGESDFARDRHFRFYFDLASQAEPELTRADQRQWLDRLEEEHDNLRAAIEWHLASPDRGSDGLALAAALHWFWLKRGHLAEGQQCLERVLASNIRAAQVLRARALMALGSLVLALGDSARAFRLLGESATLAGAAGDSRVLAKSRGLQARAAMERGDRASASQCATESGAAARGSSEPWLESFSLTYLADDALGEGDVDRAGDLLEVVLRLGRAQGDLWSIGHTLIDLALVRTLQRRFGEARGLWPEALAIGVQFADRRLIAGCLGGIAAADAAEGRSVHGAQLLGGMHGLLERIGLPVHPRHHAVMGEPLVSTLAGELGTEAFERAVAEGRAMSLSQMIDSAGGQAAAIQA